MQRLKHDYLEQCETYNIQPDTCLLSCLEGGWHRVVIRDTYNGCLLPLHNIKLFKDKTVSISELQYIKDSTCKCGKSRSAHVCGDADANILYKIIADKTCRLRKIDFVNIGLTNRGIELISKGIQVNSTLEELNLSHNHSCAQGFDSFFADSLESNQSIFFLDLTHNWLSFDTVSKIKKNLALNNKETDPKKIVVLHHGNHAFSEIMNAATHFIGVILAIVGSVVLLFHASHVSRNAFYACIIYCTSLILMYSCSTIYHGSFFLSETVYDILNIFDHAAIYLLIAGSYTPYCLISMQESHVGVYVAIAQWTLAAIGIYIAIHDHQSKIRFKTPMELTLMLTMGFFCLFVWDELNLHASDEAVNLLMAGGAAYSGGITFYLLEKKHAKWHILWHLFVILGSTFHYFSILLYVVGVEERNATGSCLN